MIARAQGSETLETIDAPVPPTEPTTQLETIRPPSFRAANPPQATSALVHDQEASFWGARLNQFLQSPFNWGPFQFRPSATYRYTYGTGFNSQPGQRTPTAMHEIAPGAIIASKHLSFSYAPTLKYYSSEEFEDTLDHAAAASGTFGVGDWHFGATHSFSKTKSPLIETGAQTPQHSHNTSLNAHYQYSDKTSFDFNLSQQLQEAQELNASKTWSLMNWINYHYSDKTLIGLGVGPGYTAQDLGSDMTFQQIQARLDWRPGQKLTVGLNGGVDIRQFESENIDNQVNPIFGASVAYAPIDATVFSLSANRSVSSTLLDAQTRESTTVSAGVRQRLLERLFLSSFGSFGIIDYGEGISQNSTSAGRSDETASFSTSLGTQMFGRGEASIFYQRSRNESNVADFSFTSNQYGFQIAYRF